MFRDIGRLFLAKLKVIVARSGGNTASVALLLAIALIVPISTFAQKRQKTKPAQLAPGLLKTRGEMTLQADQQRLVGKIYYADGNVDVVYQNARLRADHVQYNTATQQITARGHVQLDYENQHLEASDATYDLRTGRGVFHDVRGTFRLERRPSPTLLVSPNPIYFQAKEAVRVSADEYKIRDAWLTVCKPSRPVWKFYAPSATVRLQKSIHLENGNFRVWSVPVLYLPWATLPAEKRRDSGFLVPEIGDTSQKGYVVGDAFYWAPLDWLDTTVGGTYYSARGWSQRGELRMKPWENTSLDATYFGVIDRGLAQLHAPPLKQGGHEAKLLFTTQMPGGWRAVANLDQLTSFTFRLAWSSTFTEAVNSEVRNDAFASNNFDGYSLNFAALSYRNYLSATPQSSIVLRSAPEARFSSVDRQLFQQLPVYFSFDAFTGAVNRQDNVTPFSTPNFVERSEVAPTVSLPLHFGDWLDAAPSFTFRSTNYGGQIENGAYVHQNVFRNTEEFRLDMRLPVLERVWSDGDTKWKHVIEPNINYNYVTGVNDFGRFVRFDEDETLTDTNELEYGITQRLYRSTANGSEEFLSWMLAQKYFFDPTFGGALVPGQPNVFQTLDELTPFAFADEPHHFSPIVSDLRVEPGKRFDTEFIVNYDPNRNRLTAIGTLLKLKPYKESFITLAHFSVLNLPLNPSPPPPNFQQRSNQVRTLFGYGDLNRPGWNATFGASYDFSQQVFQNQIAEATYNGSCCGIGFEYRRFSFGAIRNEDQYSVVIRIANLGSVGNMRRQEKIF
ncbi:MAG TPA: LPS assembly protein LptD [Candidatus Dormibacteraeota bacterium]|nr:LPS assembly protein LptD [Candidatus Dormibacteraeota bacterium]